VLTVLNLKPKFKVNVILKLKIYFLQKLKTKTSIQLLNLNHKYVTVFISETKLSLSQVASDTNDRRILPSLTHGDRGRFAVIVFERLEMYLSLDGWNRQILDKYCRDFSVGIVAFAQPDERLFSAQVGNVSIIRGFNNPRVR